MSSVWGSSTVTLCWTAMNIYAKGDVTCYKKVNYQFPKCTFLKIMKHFKAVFKISELRKKKKKKLNNNNTSNYYLSEFVFSEKSSA